MKKIILLALVTGVMFSSCKEKKQQSQVDVTYPVMVTELSDRTLTTGYTATLRGRQTVEVRPQISGMITDILINEGDVVRKDSILFIIDQLPYKAAYEIASANVKSAEANLSTAKLVLESNQELFEQDVVSEYDIIIAQNDLSEAEAKLALARAEEVNAANNLSYTEVRSPVNGVASMIPYREGALVNSNIAEPLVTVADDSRVYAYFSMAENEVLNLIQKYGSLMKAIDQMPEVELRMSNGQIFGRKGHIDAVSGTISSSTGAVSLRAEFPNPDRILRDGGSGTVIIPSVRENCIVIPQSATYEMQDRIFVYTVVDGKAVSKQITVMPNNNGVEYIVESGLEVGEIIISEGAGLLREGTEVIVDDAILEKAARLSSGKSDQASSSEEEIPVEE